MKTFLVKNTFCCLISFPEDGSVEAAVEAGALASNAVTEELMRKMQDELLTEITRASKMDRIKMTATLKKELAKSKEEQVSITETATATSSGDLAMDFSRVSQVWTLITLSFLRLLVVHEQHISGSLWWVMNGVDGHFKRNS